MRKLFVYLVMGLLCACEVIDEADRLIPVQPDTNGNRTHVLIEFTGFRCVNCPTAAEQANELKELYKEHLIIVSLHPASNPFTQGKYDYTCPAADSIYRLMGGTATTPFPTGNIDFRQKDDRWFFDHLEWPAQVSQAMADSLCPPLSSLTDYRTSYWLVEDSVLGVQAMPDGSVNTEYYHRHVLRAVFEEPQITLPDYCNPEHCTVVKMIIDTNDQHIVNAYETKMDSYSNGLSSMDH